LTQMGRKEAFCVSVLVNINRNMTKLRLLYVKKKIGYSHGNVD